MSLSSNLRLTSVLLYLSLILLFFAYPRVHAADSILFSQTDHSVSSKPFWTNVSWDIARFTAATDATLTSFDIFLASSEGVVSTGALSLCDRTANNCGAVFLPVDVFTPKYYTFNYDYGGRELIAGHTYTLHINSAPPNLLYFGSETIDFFNGTGGNFIAYGVDNSPPPPPPPPVIPLEYFARITNAPLGIAEMREGLDSNGERELIKTFPNDWVLKVFSSTLTPDGWIKVQDMTDESFGWVQGGMARFPYEVTKQGEYEEVSSRQLTTKAERAAEIVEILNHYFSNTNTSNSLYSSDDNNTKISILKNRGFPVELLMAIIAQESGGINYDNEYVTNDFGHGITQATMKNYLNPRSRDFDHRGEFSRVILSKCPLNNSNQYKSCYDPKNIALIWNQKKKIKELGVASYKYTPLDYHDYEYNPHNIFDYRVLIESEKSVNNLNNTKFKQYSNVVQSIFANIKDGLGVLASTYGKVWVKPCTQSVVMGGWTFTCSEISIIKAVWGYNGATIDSPNYLGEVSKRLSTLNTYFNVEPYLNTDNMIEKLSYAGNHRLELQAHSPVEIGIKNSVGNFTGIIDGVIKADIDNSNYDEERERSVVFFPQGTYTYQVVGDSTGGIYGVDINIFNGSEIPLTFSAIDLPIIPGEVHTYSVDETKLANNAHDAVTVKIDKEGDGIIDRTITVGDTLTSKVFVGFMQPVQNDGSGIYKLKSTIPIKFKLTNIAGEVIPNAQAALSLVKVTSSILGDEEYNISNMFADQGNVFRYDPEGEQYVYNLSTKSLTKGTWRLTVLLDDGSNHTVLISLR